MTFKLQWRISDQDNGILVREFLKRKDISKTALTDIKFKGGEITVNHKAVNVRYPLHTGDVLIIVFPKEEPSHGLKGETLPLNILYEDPYILVINKPAGMNTIPSREHPAGSLANAIVGYYVTQGIQATAHIVTRLDRDTSGIVLVAKHRHVHHLFSMQQRVRMIKRGYEALVHGTINVSFGTIEEPIARKVDSIIERQVHPDGQYACTHFTVVERYPLFTHLKLNLETGRTHQIRVHLSFLGYPLLGDDLYGGDRRYINRQALHCKELNFLHPIKKEYMRFTAPLPRDISELLKDK